MKQENNPWDFMQDAWVGDSKHLDIIHYMGAWAAREAARTRMRKEADKAWKKHPGLQGPISAMDYYGVFGNKSWTEYRVDAEGVHITVVLRDKVGQPYRNDDGSKATYTYHFDLPKAIQKVIEQ